MTKLHPSGNKVPFQPVWLSAEVMAALNKIDGDNKAKKRLTVLLLAHAKATRQPWTTVFERRDTCRSETWYGWTDKKTGGFHAGWQHDPAIDGAYKAAEARALWWMSVKQGQAIEESFDTLIEIAPDAARQYKHALREGRMVFQRNGQPHTVDVEIAQVVKIAESVFNRVSETTAQKGTGDVQVRLTWGETGDKNDLSDGE